MSKLADASSDHTPGKFSRGDGDKAKTHTRRLSSHGGRVRRNVTAAVATPENRSRRVKVIPTRIDESDEEASLDSGAASNLISDHP